MVLARSRYVHIRSQSPGEGPNFDPHPDGPDGEESGEENHEKSLRSEILAGKNLNPATLLDL